MRDPCAWEPRTSITQRAMRTRAFGRMRAQLHLRAVPRVPGLFLSRCALHAGKAGGFPRVRVWSSGLGGDRGVPACPRSPLAARAAPALAPPRAAGEACRPRPSPPIGCRRTGEWRAVLAIGCGRDWPRAGPQQGSHVRRRARPCHRPGPCHRPAPSPVSGPATARFPLPAAPVSCLLAAPCTCPECPLSPACPLPAATITCLLSAPCLLLLSPACPLSAAPVPCPPLPVAGQIPQKAQAPVWLSQQLGHTSCFIIHNLPSPCLDKTRFGEGLDD